eukprot:3983986-Amphidinium_carterae.1
MPQGPVVHGITDGQTRDDHWSSVARVVPPAEGIPRVATQLCREWSVTPQSQWVSSCRDKCERHHHKKLS